MADELELEEVASEFIEIEVVSDSEFEELHLDDNITQLFRTESKDCKVFQAESTTKKKTSLPKITKLLALYQCKLCSFKTLQRTEMDKHKQIHVTVKKRNTSTYSPQYSLVKPKNSPKDGFKCSKCSYQSKSMRGLRLHMHIHSDGKPYKCTNCTFAAKDLKELICHYEKSCVKSKRSKKVGASNKSTYKCPVCDYHSENLSILNEHVNGHADLLSEINSNVLFSSVQYS